MTQSKAAQKMKLYRARKAGKEPPVKRYKCITCPTLHTGKHNPYCSRCWEKHDPAGRAAKAERVAKSRKKRKDQN